MYIDQRVGILGWLSGLGSRGIREWSDKMVEDSIPILNKTLTKLTILITNISCSKKK